MKFHHKIMIRYFFLFLTLTASSTNAQKHGGLRRGLVQGDEAEVAAEVAEVAEVAAEVAEVAEVAKVNGDTTTTRVTTTTPSEDNRYIIKFVNQQTYEAARNRVLFNTNNPNHIMSLPEDHAEVVIIDSVDDLADWEDNLDVDYIEPDSRIYLHDNTDTTGTGTGTGTDAYVPNAETIPWGINKVQSFQVSDDKISNQKVCIIDTGYDYYHPDLPYNSVTGYSQVRGQDWKTDGNGHGTHVAGTIAAIGNNNRGVVGVNRNGRIKLHILKIFNNNGQWSFTSNLIQAVEECVRVGSTVVNMSLGGGQYSRAENDAYNRIKNQDNVILVASAGNSGGKAKSYPASYSSVMSIAATDSQNRKAWFSQSNNEVDISAPGVQVLSTYKNGGYITFDGTSMAAPHASGVIALVWSHFPNLGANAIRNAMESSAQQLGWGNGRNDDFGHGLIRADLAYNMLASGNVGGGGNTGGGGGGGICRDSPSNWHDEDGPNFDCQWYENGSYCQEWGNTPGVNGRKTAKQACCACGGGTGGKSDAGAGGNIRTPPTPPAPTPTPPAPTPPSESRGTCGCSTCSTEILNTYATKIGKTVNEQISLYVSVFSMSEVDACTIVCQDQLPEICSACNPATCN
jgi:hypothetical protein